MQKHILCSFLAILYTVSSSLSLAGDAAAVPLATKASGADDTGQALAKRKRVISEETSMAEQLSVEGDKAVRSQGPYSPCPRKTVEDFVDLMFAGTAKRGDSAAVVRAIHFLQQPENVPLPKRQSYLLEKAADLFLLLKTLSYTNDQLPETVEPGTIRLPVELGDDTLSVVLLLVKDKEAGWVFADENFHDSKIADLLNSLKKRMNTPGGTRDYSLNLSSPLRTMYTFEYGVQGLNGYDLDDAVEAMDISDVDKQVVQRQGKSWAVQLYRILHFASPVLRESLSDNSNYEREIVLLVDPEYGMVTLKLITDDENGKKAWKIVFGGVQFINNVYDNLMQHGMVRQLDSMNWKYTPLHVRIDDFFQRSFPAFEAPVMGANIWKWAVIVVLLLSSLFLLPLVRIICTPLIKRLLRLSGLDSSNNSEKRFIRPLQFTALSYIWLEGLLLVTADAHLLRFIVFTLNIVMTFALAWVIWGLIDCFCLAAEKCFSSNLHILTSLTGHFCKGVLLILTLLYITQIFGFNGTKFFAALGIGGLALALAGKDTIENLFGSIMIIADRPFKKGDWVKVNDIEGLVEQVGVRSTRVRTFHDSLITVPNRIFISSAVDNMGMRNYRIYKAIYRVSCQTPPDKLLAFTHEMNEIILRHPHTHKDRFSVHLHDLGEKSLDVLVSVFFDVDSDEDELVAREELITQVLNAAKKMGIDF